ncbi:MAG: gliding motility-associated ABC transporter ATP-binding subunit GldA [Bacteroidales bacterium]|nr:gliding motility-associated ABC transporter ATP-binding subunit GldA [Bacteroidales bacterium]
MSIEIKHITKVYGQQKALDDITLSISSGEIVGLLGPNGAGKSTLMKILTGYISPTSGQAIVAGFDISKQPLAVKRSIGYLPENNPLYYDMHVPEFLMFVAGIYKISNKSQRVREIIEITGLEPEAHKKIGALSKGFKQRVGLAQAIIHDPPILILDEPTSGLDPNQIIEIRELIKQLGKRKTILLSTHIMQEVEAICNRVVIIHKGKLIADGSPQDLRSIQQQQNLIVVEFDKNVPVNDLLQLKFVDYVHKKDNQLYEISTSRPDECSKLLFNYAVEKKLTIISLQHRKTSLEEIFHELTKSQ